jgi:hypothetical protein
MKLTMPGLLEGRTFLTKKDVLALHIPPKDRIWVLCQYYARIHPKTLLRFMRWCMRRNERSVGFYVSAYEYCVNNPDEYQYLASRAYDVAADWAFHHNKPREEQLEWWRRGWER